MSRVPTLPPRYDGLVPLSEGRAQAAAASAADPEQDTATLEADRKRKLLAQAKAHWATAESAEAEQRARELEDLRFARGLPTDQWPENIYQARPSGIENGIPVPARPCLTINRIKQPVSQVINEARQARLGILIKAQGQKATTEGAELRQGMIRAIEQASNAAQSRLWALDRAVKAGRGYYRVLTEFANDNDFDMDLRVAMIRHQGSVYLDPGAKEFDGSDAAFCFITEDVPRDQVKARYGIDVPDSVGMESETDLPADWIDRDWVRVAEYWYVETQDRERIYDPALTAFGVPDGQIFRDQVDELWSLTPEMQAVYPDGYTPGPEARTRRVPDRKVKWALLAGNQVIEEQDWDGRWIPIIPVLGEVHDVDGKSTCVKGMVADAKDAQRSYNYMRSKQVEAVGLSPTAPYLMTPEHIEGFERMWESANTANFPYLLHNLKDDSGNILPTPQRNFAAPAIDAITLAVREAEGDIKATTGRFDPSLGAMSGERSGRAIRELKAQGETGSSHFLEQLATVSMRHEARILLDLLPKVYDRPGRIARLLGEEEQDEREVLLNAPFVQGPDGRPQPVDPTRPLPLGRDGQPLPVQQFDLSVGASDYAVAISVGKAVQTQRESNLEALQSMLEATKGAIAPMLIDIYAELLDGPMARRLSERLRKMNPQIAAAEGNEPQVPPQVQAQMQQMQQQMQQMGQALQQAQQELATQAAKAQAEVQKAQLESASRERIAALQAQADLIKTRATLDAKAGIEALKLAEARFETLAQAEADERYVQIDHAEKRRSAALEAALATITAPPSAPQGPAAPPLEFSARTRADEEES